MDRTGSVLDRRDPTVLDVYVRAATVDPLLPRPGRRRRAIDVLRAPPRQSDDFFRSAHPDFFLPHPGGVFS